jgi:hypothetical protein
MMAVALLLMQIKWPAFRPVHSAGTAQEVEMSHHSLLAGASAFLFLTGSALAESRSYTLPPFDGVSVSGGISAVVEVGGEQAVVADAPASAILDRLVVEVRGGQLEIGFEWNALDWLFNFGRNKGVVVHVSAPALSQASASAAADMDVKSISGDVLSFDSSSGASMSIQGAKGVRVSANSSSGANLTLSGSCDQLVGSTSSGASLSAQSFDCQNVDVDASSGGYASVSATVSIDADASSGGSIDVFGSAPNVQSNTSSGGSVSFAR